LGSERSRRRRPAGPRCVGCSAMAIGVILFMS
jgi:hypothetical protein